MTPARYAALQTLLAVERGAHAGAELDYRRTRLTAPDAGLLTELVYGVLRRRNQLDWLILQVAKKPLAKLDIEVLIALRLGAYQLRFLDKVPAHAAVAESVELTKRTRRSAAPFVNAVLRRLPELPASWPGPDSEFSLPDWIYRRWVDNLGEQAARAASLASLEPPHCYVRVPPNVAPPECAEPTEIEGCYRTSPGTTAGLRIQDIGSQWVASLLDVQPGQLVLDVCAAPGNKTAITLEANPRLAVAGDASMPRLKAMPALAAHRVRLDATRPLPFTAIFDRILVDAPCSGTGTLARNPDIKWRIEPGDIARHQQRQLRILLNALNCLKPGGRLVYATCSLEPEENIEVVNEIAAARIQSFMSRIPGLEAGDGFQAAVIT